MTLLAKFTFYRINMKKPIRSYGSIRSVRLLIRHPKHTQPDLYNYPAWSPRQNIQGTRTYSTACEIATCSTGSTHCTRGRSIIHHCWRSDLKKQIDASTRGFWSKTARKTSFMTIYERSARKFDAYSIMILTTEYRDTPIWVSGKISGIGRKSISITDTNAKKYQYRISVNQRISEKYQYRVLSIMPIPIAECRVVVDLLAMEAFAFRLARRTQVVVT